MALTIPTANAEVYLRELNEPDDLTYFESYNASRPEIVEFDALAHTRYLTLEQVAQARLEAAQSGKLRFGIWNPDTFVGSINLKPEGSSAEIGYWGDSRHRGRGYISMATTALAAWADERYLEVFARVVKSNQASIAVLRRSGFIEVPSELSGMQVFVYRPD